MTKQKNVTRADGRASQQAILEATLMIILRDGIRQVKYKTVAELAGVSSSSIAYYFKDIPDLIKQAFLYYLDGYKLMMVELRSMGQALIANYSEQQLQQASVREQLIEDYTEALLPMVASDDPDAQTYLRLDRIFRNETLQNPKLYGALKLQDSEDVTAMEGFFRSLGSADPEVDAVHLMSLLWFLSEQLMQNGFSIKQRDFAARMIKEMLKRNLSNISD